MIQKQKDNFDNYNIKSRNIRYISVMVAQRKLP